MKKVLQIVDSSEYIKTNCFQHQLYATLRRMSDVTQVSYKQLCNINLDEFEVIVSCLKQRTIYSNIAELASILKSRKIVIYDQDPWEAFRVDSPYKGAYKTIDSSLNVSFFAVTTKHWHEIITNHGMNSKFVRMWILPEYVISDSEIEFSMRKIKLGFVGQVHEYRKQLFDFLESKQYSVTIENGFSYDGYLKKLRQIACNIHRESYTIKLDNYETNLENGLWIKDIEAISQGCYSIRNIGYDYDSYMLDKMQTFKTYKMYEEIPQILSEIYELHNDDVSHSIKMSLNLIRQSDMWSETVKTLIES